VSKRAFLIASCSLLLAACASPRALWIGGDVHLGTGGAERLHPIDLAMSPAVGIVNLEGPIGTTEQAAASDAHKLVNGPQTGTALYSSGVVAAGIANNHAKDLGDGESTRATLQAAGVRPVGVTVLAVANLKVVVTAHDLSGEPPSDLAEQLAAARTRGDVLVATFHVDGPALLLPRPELVRAVELALDAGATVIAAHGTHAIGNVERRGDAVIAWGLGNLTF
jgi:poly-gamma-glutamate capsule biosynthesis protein CapA/YwtB (metallophosphatase superfamily)